MRSTDIAPNTFNRYAPVCVEGRCPIFDILPLQGAAPNAFNRYCAQYIQPICARMCRGALPHFRHIAPTGRYAALGIRDMLRLTF